MSKPTLVKMSRRLALRLLKKEDCKVKLDPDFFDGEKVYTTRHIDFEGDVIFIREQGMYQDFESIKSIWYTDRFGTSCWLEVEW